MAINTAEVGENNPVPSKFAGGTTPPAPVPPMQASARVLPDRRARTGHAVAAKRRRARVDWYQTGVILLILTSAAVCIYRLAWAVRP